MGFAISFQQLSSRIFVGRVDNKGVAFTEKDDLTESAIAAVADYILATYPEGMTLTRPDGSGWEIDVKPLTTTDASGT